jgi:hypothetical protein
VDLRQRSSLGFFSRVSLLCTAFTTKTLTLNTCPSCLGRDAYKLLHLELGDEKDMSFLRALVVVTALFATGMPMPNPVSRYPLRSSLVPQISVL